MLARLEAIDANSKAEAGVAHAQRLLPPSPFERPYCD